MSREKIGQRYLTITAGWHHTFVSTVIAGGPLSYPRAFMHLQLKVASNKEELTTKVDLEGSAWSRSSGCMICPLPVSRKLVKCYMICKVLVSEPRESSEVNIISHPLDSALVRPYGW